MAATQALAQTPPKAAPNNAAAPSPPSAGPVSSEPATTTASFGDWVLRCQRLGEAGKPVRVCEVAQSMQIQGQPAPIAQVAIGRPSPGDRLRITAVLPVAVSFPSNVGIAVDKEAASVDLDWRRCLPGGCFADTALKDDVLARWRATAQPGRITFKDANERDAMIPLSFRGLAAALDALAKERG